MLHTPTPSKQSGADLILQALIDQGVEVIFGYPGGAVLPIYDSLFKLDKIFHVLVRHEQAAVHAAEGYARSTGKVGVCLVTSGPGATNAVTGLTDALMDSVPVVCLSGQVATHLIGSDAFQECDITGIARSCTKNNYLVTDLDKLSQTIHEAFYIARTGRPGPVLVDIPKNIQINKTEAPAATADYVHHSYQPRTEPSAAEIRQLVDLIEAAERPVIYAGGGVINSGDEACALLQKFVDVTDFPCTLTLMGLGALPARHPNFLGMLGMHGSAEANYAMHDCDVMLAIGSRFDDRITGRLDAFSPNSRKAHIDIDPASINKNVLVEVGVVADVAAALRALLDEFERCGYQSMPETLKPWKAQISEWRGEQSFDYENSDKVIKPQYALQRLNELTKDRNSFITTEVGQHQMWAAQHYDFQLPRRWMTSGGLGTMGYGLPAAIGVQIGHPDALVIDVAGDASILMNIQELSTAAQYRLPVKIFILNNFYLGMVRQWQELVHGGRYSHSYSSSLPDFVKLAESFGGKGIVLDKPQDI
ncbi:MAG: biosynthetic-type acetolactate synthase large subunit, partial [Alphaproteobacteria bacterium]|nr:biosynthetic-type acetolactate synthase large subunit [Alphaproteobacteria bacterium]